MRNKGIPVTQVILDWLNKLKNQASKEKGFVSNTAFVSSTWQGANLKKMGEKKNGEKKVGERK